MHKKVGFLLGAIFLGVAILLMVVGAVVHMAINHNRQQILADAVPVTATISDISRERVNHLDRHMDADGEMRRDNVRYRVYITYTAGGVTVTAPLNFNNTNMRIGQPVDIYVSR